MDNRSVVGHGDAAAEHETVTEARRLEARCRHELQVKEDRVDDVRGAELKASDGVVAVAAAPDARQRPSCWDGDIAIVKHSRPAQVLRHPGYEDAANPTYT